jgi:quercetin dioxygenase-like cupin family protein
MAIIKEKNQGMGCWQMKIFNYKDAKEIFRGNKSTGKQVAEMKHTDVVLLELEKGGEIPAHSLDQNVVFAVLNGSGTLLVRDKEFKVQSGDVVEVNPGEERAWKGIGEDGLRTFVFKQKK